VLVTSRAPNGLKSESERDEVVTEDMNFVFVCLLKHLFFGL
jgi:hypothetical protein